jgi:hypothetical protein
MRRLLAAAVAALVFSGTAQAAIIQGQFTASIDSGSITQFNPDFTPASITPIAAGTTFNGTFRIDTSLLPAGASATTGDATFHQTATTHQSAGGSEWLTVQGTLGLPSPVTIDFRRDPLVPKPATATSLFPPSFTQLVSYSRAEGLLGRCCDTFRLNMDKFDFWQDASDPVQHSYGRAFEFFVTQIEPLLPGASGLPDTLDFLNEGIDPQSGIDETFGSGVIVVSDGAFDFPELFSYQTINANFTILTASFVTVTEVPAPGAPLLLLGAFLLRAARRARGPKHI